MKQFWKNYSFIVLMLTGIILGCIVGAVFPATTQEHMQYTVSVNGTQLAEIPFAQEVLDKLETDGEVTLSDSDANVKITFKKDGSYAMTANYLGMEDLSFTSRYTLTDGNIVLESSNVDAQLRLDVGTITLPAEVNCEVVSQTDSSGAKVLEPLGTVFINLMFCIVVPMVFCSIASAIANMSSVKKAGKVMGVTVATFAVTATIAAVIMYIVARIFPLVPDAYEAVEGEVGSTLGLADMIINFFTKPDFTELWSRRAILPLIVFAILCGFGIQMAGGKETMCAKLLEDLTNCIMKVVKIITYYAPIGFFGFFASLVATYGPEMIGDYAKTLVIYYVLCFAYMFVFFPIYARFGGGKGAVKTMFKHLFKPAAVSFGTCSSVATIPTNLEEAEATGISKDVSNIVMPLGATMHMDGSSMSAIVKVAFLFGFFGMDFGTWEAILAIIVAVFSSVAMSGIPGGGGTGELVLCTIFFPEQMAIAYPIAIALGNLVDPPATMVNAAGDYVVSYIVERFVSGKDWLQKKLYLQKETEE